jgi:hypothetical protein
LMSLTYVVLHIGSNINVISSSLFFWCFELYNYYIKPFFASYWSIPSARLTLHSTKLCTEFNILRKKIFFGTKITYSDSDAFLGISQILKVTRLQGDTQTNLWTYCWRNFDLSRSFEHFWGSFITSLCSSSRWSDKKML